MDRLLFFFPCSTSLEYASPHIFFGFLLLKFIQLFVQLLRARRIAALPHGHFLWHLEAASWIVCFSFHFSCLGRHLLYVVTFSFTLRPVGWVLFVAISLGLVRAWDTALGSLCCLVCFAVWCRPFTLCSLLPGRWFFAPDSVFGFILGIRDIH